MELQTSQIPPTDHQGHQRTDQPPRSQGNEGTIDTENADGDHACGNSRKNKAAWGEGHAADLAAFFLRVEPRWRSLPFQKSSGLDPSGLAKRSHPAGDSARTCTLAIAPSRLPGRDASVAELVDAVDLKSIDPRSCGFDPRRRYASNNATGRAFRVRVDRAIRVGSASAPKHDPIPCDPVHVLAIPCMWKG